MATNGAGEVDRSFSALHKLVLFTHLEERYRGRVTVILDGDAAGKEAIANLEKKFSSWPYDSFKTFSEDNFEAYYPSRFDERVSEVLAIADKQQLRTEKRKLLAEVVAWTEANDEAARIEFEKSAAEVISELRSLAAELGPSSESILSDGP